MKKSVILIAISFLLLIAGGCKKENNNGVLIESGVSIVYKDIQGNNLLDSATPNHYSYSNMHMFYFKNGVMEEYYNGKMDVPKGLWIGKDAKGQYVLYFPFMGRGINDTVTNFLQLSDTDTDTLVGIYDHFSNGIGLKKAWYNGILWKPGEAPNFTIVKK